MGALYNVTKVATAQVVGNDHITITAPAGRSLKIRSITVMGGGTVSAANELVVARSTVGTTPVAIVPVPLNADFAAATFTAAGSWAAQPTLGVVLDRIGFNSNGGGINKLYPPGLEIEIPGGGQISIRGITGTGLATTTVTVEQI